MWQTIEFVIWSFPSMAAMREYNRNTITGWELFVSFNKNPSKLVPRGRKVEYWQKDLHSGDSLDSVIVDIKYHFLVTH